MSLLGSVDCVMVSDVRAVTRPRSPSGVREATGQLVHTLCCVVSRGQDWHHGHGETVRTSLLERKRRLFSVNFFQYSRRRNKAPRGCTSYYQRKALCVCVAAVVVGGGV